MHRFVDNQAFHKSPPFLCRIYFHSEGLSFLPKNSHFNLSQFYCVFSDLFDYCSLYIIGTVSNCCATHSNNHIAIFCHKSCSTLSNSICCSAINGTIFSFCQLNRKSILEKYAKVKELAKFL